MVQGDQLYQQFRTLVQKAQAFPNSISAQQKQTIYQGVCDALKAQAPNYVC